MFRVMQQIGTDHFPGEVKPASAFKGCDLDWLIRQEALKELSPLVVADGPGVPDPDGIDELERLAADLAEARESATGASHQLREVKLEAERWQQAAEHVAAENRELKAQLAEIREHDEQTADRLKKAQADLERTAAEAADKIEAAIKETAAKVRAEVEAKLEAADAERAVVKPAAPPAAPKKTGK